MSDGRDRVAAHAALLGLDVQFVQRPEARNLEEAAALLGVGVERVVKSLVVKKHDGNFVFALIPGGRRISWTRLRAVVGVNRLQLLAPEVAREATGFDRGTITPVGSTTVWPVFVDASIGPGRIALGAGDHGWSLLVDIGQLVGALDATVADISELAPAATPG